jgi:hypothetical protein
MLNEVSNGMVLVVQQPTTVRSPDVEARAVVVDPGLLRAARDVPGVTDVRQENGRVVVTTHGGGKVIVSRATEDGQVILTPTEVVSTEAHTAVSPADFMPPKYVVDGAVTAVGLLCSTFILVPILGYLLRRRERKVQSAPAAADPQVVQRLDRIEQAIEAIALEVERSAEAQRYSARLLTERMPAVAMPVSATTESLAVPRRAVHAGD